MRGNCEICNRSILRPRPVTVRKFGRPTRVILCRWCAARERAAGLTPDSRRAKADAPS